MTAVRAKFKVTEITRQMGSTRSKDAEGKDIWVPVEMQTVKMSPVSGGSEENKTFWDASPSGSLQLGVINQAAWRHFELDREYYLDFTPADAPKYQA